MTKTSNGIDARVTPAAGLEVLSQAEVSRLSRASRGDLHELFRMCSLAVLSSGAFVDDADRLLSLYQDFSIEVVETESFEPGDPTDFPDHWLHVEKSGRRIRFVESHFDPDRTTKQLQEHFPGAAQRSIEPMGLREIFVALARTYRLHEGENRIAA